jgi:hypothetical protein
MLDIVLNRHPHADCSGTSRRDFLRAGALAGLSLPALLRAEASASAKKGSLSKHARAKSVILVYPAAASRTTTASTPSPRRPTTSAASTAKLIRWCPDCASATSCR